MIPRASRWDDPANAKLDADNEFLWRFPRRRLDAESIRDTMLAVSGSLDTYVVTVTGMTTHGAVVACILAGGTLDALNQGNLASTSTVFVPVPAMKERATFNDGAFDQLSLPGS